MRKMRIKEYEPRSNSAGSIKVPVFAVATLATAMAIHNYWEERQLDTEGYLSGMSPNEMFCQNPQFADGAFMFDDPFEQFSADQPVIYSEFWDDATLHKSVDFHFDYNRTITHSNLAFFDNIPQEVVDNPSVRFVLTGHATDDMVGHLVSGTMPPDDFQKQHAQHIRNNFQVASGRLDFIKGKLIEVGVPEERITINNLNTRYNKRAVDLEVCMPDSDTPEA